MHDPFDGLAVDPADLRRACEVQARSHLLHLREGFIETEGRERSSGRADRAIGARAGRPAESRAAPERIGDRLHRSGRALADIGTHGTISADEAQRIISPYLDAVEQVVETLDRWGSS